ncbi:MAG: hypothetical protein ACTHVE_11025, partial [Senegalia sp. (in: firmicutes)]
MNSKVGLRDSNKFKWSFIFILIAMLFVSFFIVNARGTLYVGFFCIIEVIKTNDGSPERLVIW